MQALQRIRNNPIAVLGLLAVAFFVWILSDYRASQVPQPEFKTVVASDTPLTNRKKLLPPPPASVTQPQPVSIELLPKLKPGMPRSEVEKLLGPPAPDSLQPVTQANGRFTYCSAYELLDLEPPMTIRPIRPKTPQHAPKQGEPKALVTIEYDASKPGHPLIEVHYPDPLF
jgi:hypothetical protein